MIFKLKSLADIEEDRYVDLWMDVREIKGFLIPIDDETGEPDPSLVNILINGEMQTIKTEDHIMNYLLEKFYKKAITEYKAEN